MDFKKRNRHRSNNTVRVDESEIFKNKSLLSIARREKAKKVAFRILLALAVLSALACVYAYWFDS